MTQPVPVTLADLTTAPTPEEALTQSLQICQQLGLPTTAWQAVQMIPDLLFTNATLAADAGAQVVLIAQGAYASTAALMVDTFGNSITTWMDLRLSDQYNLTRQPATYASGNVPYSSTTSYPSAWTPNNPLHFQNATTGATYSTTGSGSISVGTGNIPVQADLAGAGATSGEDVTLTMLTPLAGVTILPLASSIVGSNIESNAAALLRGQNKLATLAPILSGQPQPVPGGATGAYAYLATSIPQASAASAVPPYAVTSPITRVQPIITSGTGQIVVYIANASGPPNALDVAAVDAALNALVTPDCVSVDAAAATGIAVNVIGQIWVKASAGLTTTQIQTNIEDALANYFSSVPIGGYNTSASNIVPLAEIQEVVFSANSGTVDLSITSPNANVQLIPSAVPESGTVSVVVVLV